MTKKNVLIVSVSILLIVVIGLIIFHSKSGNPDSQMFESRARNVIESLQAGNYQEATRDFTPALKERASSEMLSKGWSKTISMYGLFKEYTITRMNGKRVYITCVFERGPVWVTVIFDPNNQISQFSIRGHP